MRVLVHRTTRGTLSALLNLALVAGAGVILIGNEMVKPEPTGAWIGIGAFFLAWSAVILSALMRPVLIKLDDHGIAIRRLFGRHRFAWDDLRWIDFTSSDRIGLVGAEVAGRTRMGGLSLRPVNRDELARALAVIKERRPDLPLRNPGAAAEKETA